MSNPILIPTIATVMGYPIVKFIVKKTVTNQVYKNEIQSEEEEQKLLEEHRNKLKKKSSILDYPGAKESIQKQVPVKEHERNGQTVKPHSRTWPNDSISDNLSSK